jgi:hypothetical protein
MAPTNACKQSGESRDCDNSFYDETSAAEQCVGGAIQSRANDDSTWQEGWILCVRSPEKSRP